MASGAILVSAVIASVAGAQPAPTPLHNQFFDWTVGAVAVPPPNYVASPFLTDANAAAVDTYLQFNVPANGVRAVKVAEPISDATAALIFNNPNYHVSYVFGDLEGPDAVNDAARLSNQVRYVDKKTLTKSANAFVGNYGFTDLTGKDLTQPGTYSQSSGSHSYSGFDHRHFKAADLSMNNPEMYPGSPSFKNFATGSTAPNIRSALFILPAWRLSEVTQSHKAGATIPWIADFNNFGTAALDSNHNGADGYLFANETHDQMLSDRDFATLVAHYRLRGADSFALLESGVVGKTQEQMQNQAREGWIGGPGSNPALNNSINLRMSAADRVLLIKDGPSGGGVPSLGDNSTIVVDGTTKSIESAGAMWSGVYSLSQAKMDVLISNMDAAQHKVTLPSNIGGYALNTRDYSLGEGSHLLVEYSLVGGKWTNAVTSIPFSDLDTDRARAGIPEPGMLSIVALGAGFFLTRRRRRSDAANV
jgi:hypothetical protein